MNKTKIPEILSLLAAAFPRFELTEDTVSAYAILLEDIPEPVLKAAAIQCARSCTFFPSVNEIINQVENIRCEVQGIPTAFEAWNDLKKAGVGYRKYPVETKEGFEIKKVDYEFLHPLVRRVAELLGWPQEFPGDNPTADRAHYFKAYEAELKKLLSIDRLHPDVSNLIKQSKSQLLEAGNGRRGKTETVSEVQRRISESA